MQALCLGIAVLFLQLFNVANCGEHFTLLLSGRNIPLSDLIWGEADPYIKVYYKFDEHSNYIGYGQTEYFNDEPNPDWKEVFHFDYVENPEKVQSAKFELWDSDWLYDEHMGDVVITLAELFAEGTNAADGVVSRTFDTGKGTLLIKTSPL